MKNNKMTQTYYLNLNRVSKSHTNTVTGNVLLLTKSAVFFNLRSAPAIPEERFLDVFGTILKYRKPIPLPAILKSKSSSTVVSGSVAVTVA